jgi:hypothetical protein
MFMESQNVFWIVPALLTARQGQNAVANAIGYGLHRSRSHRAVIRVYDPTGNVIETLEYKGDFKELVGPNFTLQTSLPSALRDNEAFFAVRTQLNGNWRCRLN